MVCAVRQGTALPLHSPFRCFRSSRAPVSACRPVCQQPARPPQPATLCVRLRHALPLDEQCRQPGGGASRLGLAVLLQIAPTGMIFIPCRNGWSHRPDEHASPQVCPPTCPHPSPSPPSVSLPPHDMDTRSIAGRAALCCRDANPSMLPRPGPECACTWVLGAGHCPRRRGAGADARPPGGRGRRPACRQDGALRLRMSLCRLRLAPSQRSDLVKWPG